MASRTTYHFIHEGEAWPVVDEWAKQANLERGECTATCRRFRRSSRLMCPIFFEITRDADLIAVSAWLEPLHITSVDSALYSASLVLQWFDPREMDLRSGSFLGALPRFVGRTLLRQLAARLKEPAQQPER